MRIPQVTSPVLAGQVLALTINVYMSKNGVFQAGLGGFKKAVHDRFGSRQDGELESSRMRTSSSVVVRRPQVSGTASLSDINGIVDTINNAFDF